MRVGSRAPAVMVQNARDKPQRYRQHQHGNHKHQHNGILYWKDKNISIIVDNPEISSLVILIHTTQPYNYLIWSRFADKVLYLGKPLKIIIIIIEGY